MIKIKVSYEKPQELETVVELLKPVTDSCKVSKNEEGRFRKAYLEGKIDNERRANREKF